MIKEIVLKLVYPNKYNSEALCKYLNKIGCEVGEETYFFNAPSMKIDIKRKDYIKIGKRCKIAEDVAIIAHDYSWEVLRSAYGEILPSGGRKIEIGNNVFIGKRATILRGVKIGDNAIIGAGSIVTKDIPPNSIAAGNPAKVISTLEEYYKKLKTNLLKNAEYEAKVFYKKHGRIPKIQETGHFRIIFLERNKENKEKFIKNLDFKGDNKEEVIHTFMNTKPIFNGYEEYYRHMSNIVNNDI